MCRADRHESDMRTAGLRRLASVKWGRKFRAAKIMLVSNYGWAACSQPRIVEMPVSMATAAVSVRTDCSLVVLTRLAGSVAQTPPHEILGFYAGSIGFRVQHRRLVQATVRMSWLKWSSSQPSV